MQLRESVENLLWALDAWRRHPVPVVPDAIQELVARIDRCEACTEPEGLIQIAVSQLQENLLAFDDPNSVRMACNGDRQPDGSPGPRLWASVSLIQQRFSRLVELTMPVPVPLVPVITEVEKPMTETNRLEILLTQLEQLGPDEIDTQISALEERIASLKKLRKLIAPATRAAGESRAKTPLDLEAVKTWLKSKGPQKPVAIAAEFKMHSTSVAKQLAKSKLFKRLDDGRFQVV